MIQQKIAGATVADLYKVHEKAELINGEIVIMSPASAGHGRKAGRIYQSLLKYEERTGKGIALPDNVGFIVDLPHRQSFSPDAAYFFGPYNEDEFIDRERPRLPRKSAVPRTSARLPRASWPRSERTISRPGLRSSGTWI